MMAFLDLIDDSSERERFRLLYNKYKGLMANIAYSRLSTQEDVEDVLQDSFFYIAKNFNKIGDIDSSQTKCFVAVITEGFAISKFRGLKKYLNTVSIDEIYDKNISDSEFNVFDESDLKMVVDTLNDEYRNMLYLKYVFGYRSNEIAELYGITDSSVRKKIQFAKSEIRNKLKGVE